MRKIIVFIGMILFLGLSLCLAQEEITITTYYPSPYGVYKELRVTDNVGIGTMEPGALLTLSKNRANGSVYIQELLDGQTLSASAAGSGIATGYSRNNGTTYYGVVGGYGNGTVPGIGLWGNPTVTSGIVSGAPDLFVDNSGNVGIGTTNPQAKLHIGGTAGVDGIKFPDGTTQTTAGAPDLKVTAATHNGNFGGWAAMQLWIGGQCGGDYKMCTEHEIMQAFRAGDQGGMINATSYWFLGLEDVFHCAGFTDQTNATTSTAGLYYSGGDGFFAAGSATCDNAFAATCCR